MRGVVAADQVQVQASGDRGVDELEEPQELQVAAAPVVQTITEPLAMSRGRTSWSCRGGRSRGSSAPGGRQDWQAGRGRVQGLDLGFHIDREKQGLVRRTG
jgi:hypothetical protein